MNYFILFRDKYYSTDEQRHLDLEKMLKYSLSNLRQTCFTNELNIYTSSLGYLLEYIKDQIVDICLLFIEPNKRIEFKTKKWNDIEWIIKLFNALKHFRIPDTLYWIFLNVPYYYENNEDITKFRDTYEKILDRLLIEWNEKNYFNENEYIFVTKSNYQIYPLSYHNESNKTILQKYCKLIRKICPFVNYVNPNLNLNFKSKLKVCFITDNFINDTSVLRDRIGIIKYLDRSQYDVYYATFNDINTNFSEATKFNKLMKDNYIKLDSDNINNCIKKIESENFNIIIYPDLGMKALQTTLAFTRLAPIQINTWGHSDTCGIDTIDYYISSKYFEVPDMSIVKNNYSEKICLLDSFGTYYRNPIKQFLNTDFKFKSRNELGFKDTDNIYWCMQTFFKINNTFINVLAEIINNDDNAKLLLSNSVSFSNSLINKILKKIDSKKIISYPNLEKKIYYNLIFICDVVLDPFPFGGCNSSLEAFALNKLVVTFPHNFINSRFTYGFYEKMGIMDCIVNNQSDYITTVKKIIKDQEFQKSISNKIKNQNHLLFYEQNSIDDWNKLLRSLTSYKS